MRTSFTVDAAHAEWRLDKFLVQQLAAHAVSLSGGHPSRSQIQKWVEGGYVTVNHKTVTKHHFLEEGDEVGITLNEVSDTPGRSAVERNPQKGTGTQSPDTIPILFEDDVLLVVDKPTGILVHPAYEDKEQTVVDWAVQHDPGIAVVGEDPARPGVVHRLDRSVSGVLIIAKTQESFGYIKKQFVARSVWKEYRAIVHGVPSQDAGVIKFKITHSKTKGGKMAARPEHEVGRDAWTEYDVLERANKRYAYLSIVIKTGRTHQIRAHLAAIDHPVVGDMLYYSDHYKSKRSYDRLYLHAHLIQITHPGTKERIQFESKVPPEFDEFMHS